MNTPDPDSPGALAALAEFDIMNPIATTPPPDPITSTRHDYGWVSLTQATATGDRKQNEDAAGHALIGDCLVVVLADGMGGHQGGREAADIAVAGVLEFMKKRRKSLGNAEHDAPMAFKLLDEAVRRVSTMVDNLSARYPGKRPGCTLLIALVYRQKFMVRHIGDSRALWAGEGVGAWELTQPHHVGHALTSAIPDPKQQDTLARYIGFERGVALALFSDGIDRPLASHTEPGGLWLSASEHKTARAYVAEQLARKEPQQDNVTAVVVRL